MFDCTWHTHTQGKVVQVTPTPNMKFFYTSTLNLLITDAWSPAYVSVGCHIDCDIEAHFNLSFQKENPVEVWCNEAQHRSHRSGLMRFSCDPETQRNSDHMTVALQHQTIWCIIIVHIHDRRFSLGCNDIKISRYDDIAIWSPRYDIYYDCFCVFF